MNLSSESDRWDVFISHASEDKVEVAIPIAQELGRAGLTVWIDAHELTLGDSLRSEIDEGLGNSHFGVVILSKAFFAKDWPTRELNALVALESKNRKVLLPVLHGITHEQVSRYSPILADKLSTSTDKGIQHIAMEIVNAVSRSQKKTKHEQVHHEPHLDHCLLKPAQLIGTKVGSYQLGDHLGSGGSGAVFRASHRDLGDQLAVKLFYPLAPEYTQFNKLFENGFRALSRLRHPNIISTKDYGQIDLGGLPIFYLVMDFVAGKTLDRWNCTLGDGREALEIRLQVARQLASGMEAAHETTYTDQVGFEVHGVLHGDLKPANVIINSGNKPIITDFLLVDVQRLLDPRVVPKFRPYEREIRHTTAAFGTPGFMAPEQMDHGIVTVSTDIFGLGVTLSQLFLPHSGELPMFLNELLSEMTAAKPGDRPNSMREVVLRQGARRKPKWYRKWMRFFHRG